MPKQAYYETHDAGLEISRLRRSPYLHFFERSGKFCFYEARLNNAAYANEAAANLLRYFPLLGNNALELPEVALTSTARQQIQRFISLGFLCSSSDTRSSLLEPVCNANQLQSPSFREIFLYLTEACNLSCPYCHVVHSRRPSETPVTDISLKVLDWMPRILDLMAERVQFIFFGGEPLLHVDKIEKFLQGFARRRHIYHGIEIQFSIYTNAQLVTPRIAEMLGQHEVGAFVSIDGAPQIYEKVRGGSSRMIEGVRELAKNVPVTAAVTISSFNYQSIQQTVEFIIEDLNIKQIRFNLPLAWRSASGWNKPLDSKKYARFLLEAIRYIATVPGASANFGLVPALNGLPRYYACSGCGGRLAISSSGYISACESLLSVDKHLIGHLDDDPRVLGKKLSSLGWLRRSSYNIDVCNDCVAMSVCAGGCAYNALAIHGDIMKPDSSICYFARSAIEQLLWMNATDLDSKSTDCQRGKHV